MEMRKCKECGKMFMPKGREKYCPDVHYRPCPDCGKPVIAKYLSDPARKCDDCKHKRGSGASKPKALFNIKPEEFNTIDQNTTPEVDTSNLVTDIPVTIGTIEFCEQTTGVVRTYIGPELKNSFIPGHDYLMKVEHSGYTYNVSATEDVTANEGVDMFRNFSSQISFHQHFARKVSQSA